MITQTVRRTYQQAEFDDCLELDKFQPIERRQLHEYPVASQTARTRARMRSRPPCPFNGPNRRGRGKLWAGAR